MTPIHTYRDSRLPVSDQSQQQEGWQTCRSNQEMSSRTPNYLISSKVKENLNSIIFDIEEKSFAYRNAVCRVRDTNVEVIKDLESRRRNRSLEEE